MKKRFAVQVTALCLTFSALTVPAGAATCFPQYTGSSGSIAAALDAVGADPSYTSRSRIAAANGISGYRGTADQNIRMLELLKRGTLVDPDGPAESYSPFFPPYSGGSPSIVTALDTLGADSGFPYRAQIAAANGIPAYSGSAAQNTAMLRLLQQGRLVRPGSSAASDTSGGLVAANLEKAPFLRQERSTCKATAAAMAVNVILGSGRYTTADMIYSGVLCRNLDGEVYTGSDKNTYRITYRMDGYAGSLKELESAVEDALSDGLPIVAAVHSASTRHHWIVVVGRDSQGNYLAVDPAGNGSGSMAGQVRRMASMGYSFGLTDYTEPHYGYISFRQCADGGM